MGAIKSPKIKVLNLAFYTLPIKKMTAKDVYNYFDELLEYDQMKLEVLGALMDINGNWQGVVDFIDYYGFDLDELDEWVKEFYNDNKLY